MIGDLRHRVTLQESVRVADGGGGFAESWQDIGTNPDIYAAIAPVSGGEHLRDHQLSTMVTHHIVIRYRSDVTPALRIVKGNIVYNLSSVIDRDGRGEYLDILATVKNP